MSRAALWATGPREPEQLRLPFEARGLSEVTISSGLLKLTPDYDVLAWLCERWAQQPTSSGVMRPTLYELGSDLYAAAPSGKDYQTLREALSRLAWVKVQIFGIDAITGEVGDIETRGSLLSLAQTRTLTDGKDRISVVLDYWLRRSISEGAPVRVPWRTLRLFGRNHQLAKRLWIYLAAERWKPFGDGTQEGCWIRYGDRLEAALAMNYERRRAARDALKQACLTIRRTDARYAAGHLELVKVGRAWHIQAERPTWTEWQELRPKHEAARAAITAALKQASV